MKRIIVNPIPPEHVIFVEDLPANPIIGFETRSEKGFFHHHPDTPNQCILRILPIISGKCFRTSGPASWEEQLNYPGFDYFLFDSEKELLLWLAQ